METPNNLECINPDESRDQLRIIYYRKSTSEISGAFSAPPGVNPYHIAASRVKKLSRGDSKLVFIWPQKNSRRHGNMPKIVIQVLRGLLVTLISLDLLHFWPGEFMPNRLPQKLPPPPPPIRCNVIEPDWHDKHL